MKVTFFLLGLIDIIAAAMIFYPFHEAIMLYIMVYMIAKGGFFLLTGLASRSIGPHCIFLCASDVLVGIALGMIVLGFGNSEGIGAIAFFIKTFGTIGALKGIYTTALPLLS